MTLATHITDAAGEQSALTYLLVFAAIAGFVLLVWIVDRVLPNKKRNTAAANALISAEVFFRPSREHVIEARERKEVELQKNGDPPKTGATS